MHTGAYIRGSSRLSSDERRQAIIEAVKDDFAKKGFERTTPKHTLVRETVRFALRGIGLREEAIKSHYNSRFTCGVEK